MGLPQATDLFAVKVGATQGVAGTGQLYSVTWAEMVQAIEASLEAGNFYTSTTIDGLIASKANIADVYTKTEVDANLTLKANVSTTYTKTEVDTALGLKANQATTYTKAEVDAAFANLIDGANEALDTLNELSTALGNDPNFAATIAAQIATKATIASTLAGYGITNAYTIAQTDAAITAAINTHASFLGTAAYEDIGYFATAAQGASADAALPAASFTKANVDALGINATHLGGQLPGYFLDWANLTSVPSTFAPSTHTHAITDITGLSAALNTKADAATTLSGYAISDAYTKVEVDGFISSITGSLGTAAAENIEAFATAAQGALADTAVQPAALALKANVTDVYTKIETDAAIAALVDAAPGALDTLNELAAALGDNPNFATDVTNAIAAKLNASAVSAFGLSLIDDLNQAAALTTLGAAAASHTHAASDVVSGVFGDARISESSVTQHEAALSVGWSQLTSIPSTFTPSAHTHAIADVTGLQTALDAKVAASSLGVAGGVATLDGSGFIPSSQLPSFVDDIIEAANYAALPGTGEAGKIYVTLNDSKTYRWSGSAYAEIIASPGTTDNVTEGSTNLYYTVARANSAIDARVTKTFVETLGIDVPWTDLTGVPSDVTNITSLLAAKAPLASPAFTGTPTAPTQTPGNNSTRLATTAYVDAAVVAAGGYNSASFDADLATKDTDDLAEGVTNLYYTSTRANSAIDTRVTKSFVEILGIDVPWANLTGVPSTFTPSSHTHVIADTTGLQTALDAKVNSSLLGVADGVATLDSSGLVPSSQLPSFVDDVIEAANFAALPGTGTTGKIYVTLDNNKTYRWSGSAYVEISPSPGSTDSVTEGATNLYYTTARANSAIDARVTKAFVDALGINATHLNSQLPSYYLDYNNFTNKPTLGTAAAYAIGTSGATIPLLSTANTWTTTQTFNGVTVGTYNGINYGAGFYIRNWNSSDTDIDALIGGTASGGLIEGPSNAHLVIGIRGNDSTDGLYVIDTNNGGAVDYAQVLLALTNTTFDYKGSAIGYASRDMTWSGSHVFSNGLRGGAGISIGNDVDRYIYGSDTDSISIRVGNSAAYKYFQFDEGGSFQTPDGSLGAPAFAFSSDPDTGIYRVTTNSIGIAAGGSNQVTIDTSAVTIANTSKLSFGSSTRQMIDLWSTSFAIGVQNGTQYYRTGGRFSWFNGGSHSVTENDPGSGGTRLMTLTSSGLVVGNVTPSSSGLIITRRSGDAIEWGHTTAAYHNTLGAEAGSGAGNLIFQGMNGTTINTYKTTGVKASIMKSDNAGGFLFGTVASANADNQAFINRFSFDLTNAYLKGSTTESQSLYIGHGRSGSGNSAIYLIGDTTYSSWGATFYRDTGGANAHSWLRHRGTGGLYFDVNDAGSMHFRTNATTRIYIDSGGQTTFTGLIVGKSTSGSNVNTNNDTGSFSVRGDASNAASISFHRTGAYAINMGLGTDNVFRIGGWSATGDAFRLSGAGELTVLQDMNAVDFNASSDKRGKQKIKTAPSGKVIDMRGVLFERKKTKKPSAGVIAQELEEIAPELVSIDADGYKRVNYNGIIAYLIEDIKALRKDVEKLKKAA